MCLRLISAQLLLKLTLGCLCGVVGDGGEDDGGVEEDVDDGNDNAEKGW